MTAMDIWMGFCAAMLILVLMETVLVHYLGQENKPDLEKDGEVDGENKRTLVRKKIQSFFLFSCLK